MLGPLVNSAALMIGAVSGALLGRLVPRRVKEALLLATPLSVVWGPLLRLILRQPRNRVGIV